MPVRAKFHIILNYRAWPILNAITDRYSVSQRAVAADDSIRMYENVAEMVNTQSGPNSSFKRNTYPREGFYDAKNQPVKFQLDGSRNPGLPVEDAASQPININRPD